MTRHSRRRVLLGGTAGVVGGFAGWWLSSGLGDHILRIVGESFGAEFERAEGTRRFVNDLVHRLKRDRPGEFVLAVLFYRARPIAFPELLPQERQVADFVATQFALASNVLQVIAGVEPTFEYYGLYSPLTDPCRNPLSAAWAV